MSFEIQIVKTPLPHSDNMLALNSSINVAYRATPSPNLWICSTGGAV